MDGEDLEFDKDFHRPAKQWLRLSQAIGGLEQPGEVVEPNGDSRVILAVALFTDLQCPAIKGLCLSQAICATEHPRA